MTVSAQEQIVNLKAEILASQEQVGVLEAEVKRRREVKLADVRKEIIALRSRVAEAKVRLVDLVVGAEG